MASYVGDTSRMKEELLPGGVGLLEVALGLCVIVCKVACLTSKLLAPIREVLYN